jgi:alpha-acetolactate decarboxylase
MRLNRPIFLGGAAAIVWLLAGAPARSQQPMEAAAMLTARQPYDIQAFGAFRQLILAGDFSRKVDLAAAMARRPTTGVGAVADARGEITIHDGRLIISYGRDGPDRPAADESAALLATGTVTAWQTVAVPHDVAPDEIETYLARTAAAHGLDGERSFPFQIRGTLMSYTMHVNAAPTGGPHGMGQPIALTRTLAGETVDGLVAGFYVSRDLVGIVSHGGARTHSHWISPDLTSTGHLDRWGLKAGAVLSLPQP